MSFFENLSSQIFYIRKLKAIENNLKDLKPGKPLNVADEIEGYVDQSQNREALVFEGVSETYLEFDHRANQYAHWARARGFMPGDCIALFRENHPDFLACWFGLAKVGITTALINYHLVGEGLIHCCRVVDARAIITTSSLAKSAQEAAEAVGSGLSVFTHAEDGEPLSDFDQVLNGMGTNRPDAAARSASVSNDTLLYVYTSGTTGLPKAAKMTHARALQMLRTFRIVADIEGSDRLLLTLPLYHATGGLCGVGAAFSAGATLLLQRNFSASAFWQQAKETQATALVYVGELGRYLINRPAAPEEKDHFIRKAFGNGMRPEVWEELTARTGIEKLYEFYGSTEGNISLFNLDGRTGSIGRIPPLAKPLMPIRLVKIDAETEEVVRTDRGRCIETQPGEPGEAVGRIVNTDSLKRFEGYGDDAQTEKKILRNVFKEGDAYFRSGDLLIRDDQGYFYFQDRLGDTFRWKSENVSTTEVGGILSGFPKVATANVYGVTVPGHDGRAGMGALTVHEGFELHAFSEYVQQNLPAYARPVFLRLQEEDDLTGTLKFKKSTLQRQGFDPSVIGDDLFYLTIEDGSYAPIDLNIYQDIIGGKVRL